VANTSLDESEGSVLQTENACGENLRDLSKAEEAVREADCVASECFLERDAILYEEKMTEVVQRGSVSTQPQIRKKIKSLSSLGKRMQLEASLLQVFPGVRRASITRF